MSTAGARASGPVCPPKCDPGAWRRGGPSEQVGEQPPRKKPVWAAAVTPLLSAQPASSQDRLLGATAPMVTRTLSVTLQPPHPALPRCKPAKSSQPPSEELLCCTHFRGENRPWLGEQMTLTEWRREDSLSHLPLRNQHIQHPAGHSRSTHGAGPQHLPFPPRAPPSLSQLRVSGDPSEQGSVSRVRGLRMGKTRHSARKEETPAPQHVPGSPRPAGFPGG